MNLNQAQPYGLNNSHDFFFFIATRCFPANFEETKVNQIMCNRKKMKEIDKLFLK